MRNVLIDGFEIGCKLKDSLYLEFNNCRFTYNKTAIQGRLGEVSGPNSIRLSRCDFQYNAEFVSKTNTHTLGKLTLVRLKQMEGNHIPTGPQLHLIRAYSLR
mgnify:CR=1 FL=1